MSKFHNFLKAIGKFINGKTSAKKNRNILDLTDILIVLINSIASGAIFYIGFKASNAILPLLVAALASVVTYMITLFAIGSVLHRHLHK